MTISTTAAACLIDAAPASFRPEIATQGKLTVVAQETSVKSTESIDEATDDEDDTFWETPMPPSLEDYIPPESLPEVIAVRDGDTLTTTNFSILADNQKFASGIWETFTDRNAITFVRKYPPLAPTPVEKIGAPGDTAQASPARDASTASLDLRNPTHLGRGNHSAVWLAPLTLPPATSVASDTPPAPRAVAVKLATWEPCERRMLAHEARVYSAFPRALQDAPDAAVPKFYGYYEPVFDAARINMRGFHRSGRADAASRIQMLLTKISPILLIEHCGQPVAVRRRSTADNRAILALIDRVHGAGFVQGSFYQRNVLVQPGPLDKPHGERSLEQPSFRIIDFGRGMCESVDRDGAEYLDDEIEYERSHTRRVIEGRERWD
ncbi:hypothetical protein BC834DRAFT_843260 [Gloeopeniophorella convolvens]|nr:hypothetical protein BC834DRAFT_843260 [Gloeopeniophorella convolvens]